MESPNHQSNKAMESAARWNVALARRVTRWKRLRLALAIVFAGIAIAALFLGSASIWSVPCFIAAFIAYLLYLDSRDQLREIRARNWATITPRISGIAERNRERAAEKASSP